MHTMYMYLQEIYVYVNCKACDISRNFFIIITRKGVFNHINNHITINELLKCYKMNRELKCYKIYYFKMKYSNTKVPNSLKVIYTV